MVLSSSARLLPWDMKQEQLKAMLRGPRGLLGTSGTAACSGAFAACCGCMARRIRGC